MCVMDREATWRERAERVVNRVNDAFPRPEFKNWGLCEELILSATATSEQISIFDIETENAARLLNYLKKANTSRQSLYIKTV